MKVTICYMTLQPLLKFSKFGNTTQFIMYSLTFDSGSIVNLLKI